MGLLDFLGFGQPSWTNDEETVRNFLKKHLTKNNPHWSQSSSEEQQKRLAGLMEKFSDRIEDFLAETMGKPAFFNDFAFRFVGRPDIPEELKDKVLKIGIQNNKDIEIDTRQFPDRYKTLTAILYHIYQSSGKTDDNFRAIWKDFLKRDLQ